jgi:hypothetical protein
VGGKRRLCRETQPTSAETGGVNLQIFISPTHAAQWEAMRNSALYPTFDEWKRRLVEITPVWDFSGYNEVSGEPLVQVMRFYLESSHYLPNVGDMILRRIYAESTEDPPTGFGQYMTRENVATLIERFHIERERWAASRPDEVRQYETWARSSE